MKIIFIDSDIILDLIARREPFYAHAAQLFTSIEENKIKAVTSPVIFSNIFYILRKLKGRLFALNKLKKIRMLINITNVDEKIIDLTLVSEIKDFEDAIQLYAAKNLNIKYLITRNIKDYKDNEVIAITAEEYNNITDSTLNFNN